MDHMIKEKFIVTDGEKWRTKYTEWRDWDIEIDQIIENISSEESNIYFFDKDLSEKPEMKRRYSGMDWYRNQGERKWAADDLALKTIWLFLRILCRNAVLFSKWDVQENSVFWKKLRSNLLKFCHRYREEHAERICKVETEVKDRSEGYCENDFIKMKKYF